MRKQQDVSFIAQTNEKYYQHLFLDLFDLTFGTKIYLFAVSISRIGKIGKYCWKETKKRNGRGCDPSVMCCSSVSHEVIIPAFMWFSSHLSYPLPSVWLGWPWSPKSRSSPLKIRLLISPPVECVMPLHGYLLSHIILLVTTTCLLLFQDLNKMHNSVRECCGPVFWYTA